MSTPRTDNNEYADYGFSSYGVKIGVSANSEKLLEEIKREIIETLPFNPSEIFYDEAEHFFEMRFQNGKFLALKKDVVLDSSSDRYHIFKLLQNEIRYAVSEFAVSKVFIHAGAVSFNNEGIIFPAKSFGGKSTLTAAFIKAGADYYSDDMAVLDENAYLHPFPKPISLRGIKDNIEQVDIPFEQFGAKVTGHPVRVKYVLLTEFEEGAKWSPEFLSPGEAIMEIIPHTVPIRTSPKFSLAVLHKLTKHAIIAKSKRGNAQDFLNSFLCDPRFEVSKTKTLK